MSYNNPEKERDLIFVLLLNQYKHDWDNIGNLLIKWKVNDKHVSEIIEIIGQQWRKIQ